MPTPALKWPFLTVNPKSYLYGPSLVTLAQKTDRLAIQYDIDVLFTGQLVDLPEIVQTTKRLIVTAQHVDGIDPGRGMGKILACGLANRGIRATFLNHFECPLSITDLAQSIHQARKFNLLTIVCANTLEEAKALAVFKPDVMVCELNELIGTGIRADKDYMIKTTQAIKKRSPTTQVLQAAGIKTADDVYQVIKLGADGSGGTSGIVQAQQPIVVIEAMMQALVRARQEKGEYT